MSVSTRYRPEPLFEKLGPEFADPVTPARFPEHTLRWRNQGWAARVGLDSLSEAEWEAHFASFEPLPGNIPAPLAMRYHGHQFRAYNPEIGDGRGFLFAQLRDDAGRLLDLATKGSGQTPYSRFGDGRLTLKGGVREVLAAEMLEALGVYTSKAFSLFETGEQLMRGDEPSPTRSSVLVRLSHSHIRFGTFQRLAFIERPDLIRALLGHCTEAYFPDLLALEGEARATAFLERVVREAGRLAGSWMAAGFVHGVLNTDNLTVTGESFDYGPWRFAPSSDPKFTAAYFDETGLYAFGRQPEAVSWALAQLGGALSLVASIPPLEEALVRFGSAYQEGLRAAMFARLKLRAGELEPDLELLQALFDWLTRSGAAWEQFFHDWIGGEASAARAAQSPQAHAYADAAFAPVRRGLEARTRDGLADFLAQPLLQQPTPATLLIDDVEALWAPIAEHDDWSAFEAKLADIACVKRTLQLSCHQSVAPNA
jgi:uncharacterized protein YdiU (UPF0061 family)